ncbi:GFA family protein [Pseudomonas sp. SBB6]|nr:GFA family protein [Pseudomonas sp. SBB6]MCP3749529.1 GFA family protein [Pseudomonas sp. SBB6]
MQLFLRRGRVHRQRRAGRDGLLPLRVVSAGPVNAFTLWKPEAVQVTRGADNIGTYNKTLQSFRKWCKTCGGHIFTEHPGMGLIDVYAALIPGFAYSPGVHVHYQESVLRIKDGLPKLKDVPKALGGSGISMDE